MKAAAAAVAGSVDDVMRRRDGGHTPLRLPALLGRGARRFRPFAVVHANRSERQLRAK